MTDVPKSPVDEACSPSPCSEENELATRMTAAMRDADERFMRSGGTTRHHVRDFLLPVLERHGLRLVLLPD